MKVLIVGGGIGGVTAALACIDQGFEVELYERAAALSEIGAGIQISPNGAKVLIKLGLKDALEAVAARPAALEMNDGVSGDQLFAIPMGDDAVRRFGAPYYNFHRADLMQALAGALQARAPQALKLNKELVALEQSYDAATLIFADGARASGDVVIGADGIHSRVRAALFGDKPARFTGNVAWRLVVDAKKFPLGMIPPRASVWVGEGRHAVTYHLRDGALVNFVGVVERKEWRGESWTEEGANADFAADFAGWARPVTAVIDAAERCYRWALFDRSPLPQWSRGRATLLGDACHPMLPFLAQGAALAIEDAWVIARALKTQPTLPAAFVLYEGLRKSRTARAQRTARARAALYHAHSLPTFADYLPVRLAAAYAPRFITTRQDWLFAHDVTRGEQSS